MRFVPLLLQKKVLVFPIHWKCPSYFKTTCYFTFLRDRSIISSALQIMNPINLGKHDIFQVFYYILNKYFILVISILYIYNILLLYNFTVIYIYIYKCATTKYFSLIQIYCEANFRANDKCLIFCVYGKLIKFKPRITAYIDIMLNQCIRSRQQKHLSIFESLWQMKSTEY